MATNDARRRALRTRSIECLEDRRVMAADPLAQLLGGSISHHGIEDYPIEHHSALVDPPLEQHAFDEIPMLEHHGGMVDEPPPLSHHATRDADFWIDPSSERDVESLLGDIEQTLASAHGLSGLTQVRNNYGFVGTGQTVAIIDSGIAYDHYALGGKFGPNYRVVGGWDFSEENDANPYDDGPEGSHGTHVAGIVGADRTGTADDGVAPGVDLVGLRVFNDVGDGYFHWVEYALQWVHQNRNAFENPITAVNLSLGTAWNSTTVPSWSTLENEFAQLKADGIFVTVSAGNSFTSYNTPGLSYPAASPSVVPVMSVDDNGSLSFFSQRHSTAIAAPGRFIVSTIPDYTGNHNGVADDFASYSGTSMAAPYVAGASVIVREAMQFVGYTNITQDTIFGHMMATADTFFDSATNQNYKRLNLNSAINALMPSDDYGSTAAAAHNLGTLSGDRSISGLIGRLTDKDFFTFTAGANATVQLSIDSTHGLTPVCTVTGSQAVGQGNTWSFDVVAGQVYTISLETSAGGGIGYYDVELTSTHSVDDTVTTIKSLERGDGVVFSLDSAGWLSIGESKIWDHTYDFSITADGTLYWLSENGLLERLSVGGTWQYIDDDATKYAVSASGVVYSLGRDGWLSVNGNKAWNGTNDFDLASDQSLYWQGTNNQLWQRPTSGTWALSDNSVSRFAVQTDGTLYTLQTDNWLKVNGHRVWSGTHDFTLTADQSLYWQGTTGGLYVRPEGGAWQAIDNNVVEFAIRHDGKVYSLETNGNVTAEGAVIQSGIVDLRTDDFGNLILLRSNGSQHEIAGRYIIGGNYFVTNDSIESQPESVAQEQTGHQSNATASTIFFGAHQAGMKMRGVEMKFETALISRGWHGDAVIASSEPCNAIDLVLASRRGTANQCISDDIDAAFAIACSENMYSEMLATEMSNKTAESNDCAVEYLFQRWGVHVVE